MSVQSIIGATDMRHMLESEEEGKVEVTGSVMDPVSAPAAALEGIASCGGAAQCGSFTGVPWLGRRGPYCAQNGTHFHGQGFARARQCVAMKPGRKAAACGRKLRTSAAHPKSAFNTLKGCMAVASPIDA